MFDEVAPRYELVNTLMTFGMDRSWRRHTIDALALHPGTFVLDLACGTGDLARELSSRGYATVGLDLSEGMLRAAHDVARRSLPATRRCFPSPRRLLRRHRLRLRPSQHRRPASELRRVCAGHEVAWTARPARGRPALEPARTRRPRRLVRTRGPTNRSAALGSRGLPLPASVGRVPAAARRRSPAMLEKSGYTHVEQRSLLFGTVQIVTATRLPGDDEPRARARDREHFLAASVSTTHGATIEPSVRRSPPGRARTRSSPTIAAKPRGARVACSNVTAWGSSRSGPRSPSSRKCRLRRTGRRRRRARGAPGDHRSTNRHRPVHGPLARLGALPFDSANAPGELAVPKLVAIERDHLRVLVAVAPGAEVDQLYRDPLSSFEAAPPSRRAPPTTSS